jgi:hypothetical protein
VTAQVRHHEEDYLMPGLDAPGTPFIAPNKAASNMSHYFRAEGGVRSRVDVAILGNILID